jgi:hypothetical protein
MPSVIGLLSVMSVLRPRAGKEPLRGTECSTVLTAQRMFVLVRPFSMPGKPRSMLSEMRLEPVTPPGEGRQGRRRRKRGCDCSLGRGKADFSPSYTEENQKSEESEVKT